jgi:AcrR family transcriptional regulator
MVEHKCAQYHVELRLRKRQALHNGSLEAHVDSCLGCFRTGARDHGWGRVDAEHVAVCADLAFGDNRQGSSSTADVEHGFARRELRRTKQLLAKSAIAPAGQEPDEEVVARGPLQNATNRGRCCVGRWSHAGVSVDLNRTAVKNTHRRPVRNGTSGRNRPETQDRRVRKTKTSLHDALIGLAREKPYPSIAVKEILGRANVGRSTFYTHFRNKDDLLESGIRDILPSTDGHPRSGSPFEHVVAFSLPLLTHIDEHRRAAGATMRRNGRLAMHTHLQRVLANLIAEELSNVRRRKPASQLPTDLLAKHVAATFVLVLNWWVDSDMQVTPVEVDSHFRALVQPILTTI